MYLSRRQRERLVQVRLVVTVVTIVYLCILTALLAQ